MKKFLRRVPGVAIVLVVLCAGFGLTSPGFATSANIANILMQSTILLLLALPMTVIIMTEGLDLSIGAVLTFASIVLAVTVVATGSPTLAFLAALAVGLCFGFGNGVLIAVFDIPPFITTLGTLGIAQGLSLLVTDGQSVVGIPRSIENIYSGTAAGIPLPVIIAALAYALTHVLLYHTRFGTYVFALGGNREALKVAGISVSGMLILNQARFENRERQPTFFGLKVDQHAFVSDTVFQAGVSLVGNAPTRGGFVSL